MKVFFEDTEKRKSSWNTKTPSASAKKPKDDGGVDYLRFGINEDHWLPQTERGGADKFAAKTQKMMWKSIIQNIKSQLPSEYRRLRYVGPMPPTDAPLFSPKISNQVKRAHLFFGRHKHDPHSRIRVEIGRRGDLDWRVLGMSHQSHK